MTINDFVYSAELDEEDDGSWRTAAYLRGCERKSPTNNRKGRHTEDMEDFSEDEQDSE